MFTPWDLRHGVCGRKTEELGMCTKPLLAVDNDEASYANRKDVGERARRRTNCCLECMTSEIAKNIETARGTIHILFGKLQYIEVLI